MSINQRHNRWISYGMEAQREVNPVMILDKTILRCSTAAVVLLRASCFLIRRTKQIRKCYLSLVVSSVYRVKSTIYERVEIKVTIGQNEHSPHYLTLLYLDKIKGLINRQRAYTAAWHLNFANCKLEIHGHSSR